MGVFYETIPDSLIKWILEQKIIYIASAPLSSNGHVNVSPKGGQYFGVVDNKTLWYLDLSGSGVETLSHLHEPGNGRITVMLNAFDGPPKIVRLWGQGSVLEFGSQEFDDFVGKHDVKTIPGTRSIVVVDIHQVGSSCGFSVPFYDFKEFRPTLNKHWETRLDADGQLGMDKYWAYKNAWSMDGIPGMQRGVDVAKREQVKPIKKMVGPFAPEVMKKSANRIGSTSPVLVSVSSFCLGLLVAFILMEYIRGDLQGDLVNYTEEIRSLFK